MGSLARRNRHLYVRLRFYRFQSPQPILKDQALVLFYDIPFMYDMPIECAFLSCLLSSIYADCQVILFSRHLGHKGCYLRE